MLEWISNGIQSIIDAIGTGIEFLGMLITNIINGIIDAVLIIQTTWRFIGELPQLFSWIPLEIYYLLYMAIMVIVLLTIIKIVGEVM